MSERGTGKRVKDIRAVQAEVAAGQKVVPGFESVLPGKPAVDPNKREEIKARAKAAPPPRPIRKGPILTFADRSAPKDS